MIQILNSGFIKRMTGLIILGGEMIKALLKIYLSIPTLLLGQDLGYIILKLEIGNLYHKDQSFHSILINIHHILYINGILIPTNGTTLKEERIYCHLILWIAKIVEFMYLIQILIHGNGMKMSLKCLLISRMEKSLGLLITHSQELGMEIN